MIPCRVCGEEKPKDEFKRIPYFSDVKARKVMWCRDCQKMYLTMKKEKQISEKIFVKDESKFIVSFQ